MSEQPPSWNDLKKPAAPPADDLFTKLCVQVFTTPSGKALLAELRRKYIDRSMSPLADERVLRKEAVEQHLIRELELTVDRGIAATKRKTP